METEKIAIIDGHVTNPGDIGWGDLGRLPGVVIYERSNRKQFLERIADVEIVVTNKQVWDKEAFDAAPKLKLIALTSTGYNVVDLAEATAHGVVVSNVPAYSTPDVAQHTFALLLELTNHVGALNAGVQAGDWVRCPDFCYWNAPIIELADKTFGIIGMGSIGSAVCAIASSFGMNVIFYDHRPKPERVTERVRQVSLDELWASADIISLHCALVPETEHIINASSIAQMKDGVLLINAARGGLVDEAALRAGLDSGHVGGCGLDVLDPEPMAADCPLLGAPRTIITPHVAWASVEARTRLYKAIAANIQAFLDGAPQNVVNPDVLALNPG